MSFRTVPINRFGEVVESAQGKLAIHFERTPDTNEHIIFNDRDAPGGDLGINRIKVECFTFGISPSTQSFVNLVNTRKNEFSGRIFFEFPLSEIFANGTIEWFSRIDSIRTKKNRSFRFDIV